MGKGTGKGMVMEKGMRDGEGIEGWGRGWGEGRGRWTGWRNEKTTENGTGVGKGMVKGVGRGKGAMGDGIEEWENKGEGDRNGGGQRAVPGTVSGVRAPLPPLRSRLDFGMVPPCCEGPAPRAGCRERAGLPREVPVRSPRH